LQIELSGRVCVEAGETVLEGRSLPGRQVRLAFAYLVVNRQRPVPRDELASGLWPGMTPPSWERNLRVVISRLRAALAGIAADGPVELANVHGCYQLRLPAGTSIDIEEAAAAAARAEAALRAGELAAAADQALRAAELARRPFLPGDESTWVEHVRVGRRRLLVRALDTGVHAMVAAGDARRAVGLAEEAVELEPLWETGYQQLIRALGAAGDRARALQVYERCRQLLAEELGVAPSPETEVAHLELLRADVQASTARHLEPPPVVAARAGSVFVGRSSELATLRGALDAARDGRRPIVATVAGERGIGKSALAVQFALAAHQAGATVLAGRCDEETPFPYQPFVEALHHVAETLPLEELSGSLGRDGPELARLLPVLHERMPTLLAGGPVTDGERYRLYEAVARLLARLAQGRPLVLILEDVQWAQKSTLLLLRHIARYPAPLPLLVIATCSTEHGGAHVETFSDLRRDDLVVEITLPGLDEPDVAALVAAAGGISSPLSERIAEVSEGNPLYVREIARHLAESGASQLSIPRSVRGAIMRRLDLLPRPVLETLTIGAASGRDFSLETLCLVTDREEAEVLAELEVAERERIIVPLPGAPDVWSFSHALVRETLYEDISAGRRARLHRSIAEVLVASADGPTPHLAEVARHLAAAGSPVDLARAFVYARSAGQAAVERQAFEEAAAQYELALRLLDRAPDVEETQRCAVLMALAEARAKSGDTTARAAYHGVVELARRGESRCSAECLARAAIGMADHTVSEEAVDHAGIGLLEEGLSTLGDASPSLRAQLLGRLAARLYDVPASLARRDALSAESVALARQVGDPLVLAACLHARTLALWGPGGADERLATGLEITQLAEQGGDVELALHGHAWCQMAHLEMGDVASLDRDLAAYEALTGQLRHPHVGWYAHTRRAMRALLAGDLDTGERRARRALEAGWSGRRMEVEKTFATQMTMVWLERPTAEAVQFLEAGRLASESRMPVNSKHPLCWHATLGAVAFALGETETARGAVDHLTAVGLSSIPRTELWSCTMACLTAPLARLGSPEAVSALYEVLLPHAGTNAQIGGAVAFAGSFSHHLGVLAAATRRWDEAEHHFATAAAMHARMGAAVHLAHTRVEWAAMLAARDLPGLRERCDALLESAGAQATGLRLPALSRRIADLRGAALRRETSS
jgi:DNA-binding SARP family transcriptional activator